MKSFSPKRNYRALVSNLNRRRQCVPNALETEKAQIGLYKMTNLKGQVHFHSSSNRMYSRL